MTGVPNLFVHEKTGVYYVKKVINGRQLKKSTGTRDFKAALRVYGDTLREWARDGGHTHIPTVEEYWSTYRRAYTVRKTAIRVLEGGHLLYLDDQLVRPVLKFLGHRKLNSLTQTTCQEFANWRRQYVVETKDGTGKVVARRQISEGTVTRELNFFQAMLQRAVEDGVLPKNPMKRIEREPFAVRGRVLSLEEQAKLLPQLSPRCQRWVLFMLGTGLRLEEARGIDAQKDVDLEARTVRVTRKTRGLKKTVQLFPLFDPDVVAVLREQLREDGRLWHANQQHFRDVLSRACVRAGIPHISPHTLRHTFATRYLQAGGDIYKLSLLLGHTSVKTTEKVYAHLMYDDLFEASKGISLGLRQEV